MLSVCIGAVVPIFADNAKTISADDFINGIIFQDLRIPFFSDAVTDTLTNTVDYHDLFHEHENYLIAYAAPHMCGGCAVHDMNLLNSLASQYPEQVLYLVQNPFYKETIKAVRSVSFGKGIRVLLDTDGKNIAKFCRLSEKFYDAWLFIVNKDNEVLFARAVTYEHKPDMEYRAWFERYANEMLRMPRRSANQEIPKLY